MAETIDEILNLDIESAFEFIIKKRDDAIEHLIDNIKINSDIDKTCFSFDNVLKINKQLKIMEDVLIMERIIKSNK